MKRTIEYNYWETEIPYRCRKPREVEHSAKMTVTIPEVTDIEAPVAITQHTPAYSDESITNDLNFRWFRKHLYTPYLHYKIVSGGENRQVIFEEVSNPDLWGRYSQQETRKNLLAWARGWFILDGLV